MSERSHQYEEPPVVEPDPIAPDATGDDDARPRVKAEGQSKFFVNDSVYLRAGRGLTGPYLIARVTRLRVYTLSDQDGNPANNGAEVAEKDLELISRG